MIRIPDRTQRIVHWAGLCLAAVALVAGGYALHWALAPAEQGASAEPSGEHAGHPETPQVEQNWTCSMHPQIRQPKRGQCPICGMDLIPVRSEAAGAMRQFRTSRQGRALMDIQTSRVERKFVTAEIRMVGRIDYDETRLAHITSWVPGRIERLFIDYTGIAVNQGDHMVTLYSPELLSGQEELLQALRAARSVERSELEIMRETSQATVEAAREKLRLWGLTPEQVEAIEERGTALDHVTIYAPSGGIVIEKNAAEGMYVRTGQRIYTLADLRHVWVKLDAYESDLQWLRYGQKVTFTTEAYPGEPFTGTISFIAPVLDPTTRTIKVRVDVPNADGRLKPEMFVRAVVRARVARGGRVMAPDLAGKWICRMHPSVIESSPGDCPICDMPLARTESLGYVSVDAGEATRPLVIPASAALVTGTRAVVYLERDPFAVSEDDIVDWSGLVAELRRQRQASDPTPARRPWSFFGAELQQRLAGLGPTDTVSAELAASLLGELNDILDRRDFYDAAAWQDADLGDEAQELLGKGIDSLSPREVVRLNRRLLERAWQGLIVEAVDKPTFVGREIVLGPRAGDYYIVRYGLAEGDVVVTNGTFKIDSAVQIQAKPSMMTPQGGGGPADAPAAGTLPSAFEARLKALVKSYQAVGDAMDSEGIEAIRAAFAVFGDRLDAVNGRSLAGERRMLWDELAMLLENNAVEGHRYVESLADAQAVYERLEKTMRRLRNAFLPARDRPPAQAVPARAFAVPEGFRAQLGDVWSAYQQVHAALAADSTDEAGAAVEQMNEALASVDMMLLEGEAHAAWMEELESLRTSLSQMAGAEDLESLRRAFAPMSEQMAVVLRRFGRAGSGEVYMLKCPMAFNNRGAFWLQNQREVLNPYFGATMLRCGEVVERIEPAPAAGGAATPKGGHQHD